jgi:hypothetical protein
MSGAIFEKKISNHERLVLFMMGVTLVIVPQVVKYILG